MFGEAEKEYERLDEIIMDFWEDLDQHKEEILEASTKTKEYHDFENMDLCV